MVEQRRATPLAHPAMVRLSFRVFRPALPARVALSPQPSFVAAQGVRGKVLDAAGPWRTSGDWWIAGNWERETWDVALPDGLYRLFLNSRGWFVEGSYD
jgi:protein ImuB